MRNVMTAEADADVLRLEEDLVAPGPAFSSRAGRLGSAEWLAQVAHVLAVDETHAGFDSGRHAVRAAEVLGPDVAREPVRDVVRNPDRIGLVVERDQAGDRTEDLVLRDPHPVVDVGEDG